MKSDPILNGAPGPTPWWVPDPPSVEERLQLSWHAAGSDRPCVGKIVLRNVDGQRLLLADHYCWMQWFESSHLLTWHQLRHDSSASSQTVRFHAFQLSALEPLAADACQVLDVSPDRVMSQGGHLAAASFDAQLTPGEYRIDLPFPYSELDELLVLVSPGRPHARVHLWVLKPRLGIVDVIPQEWFNGDGYDYGYQWITRMARDSQGRLVGEGIRLGVFRVDPTGRNIEKWLNCDPSWPFWNGPQDRS